jgi:hypothetical protein
MAERIRCTTTCPGGYPLEATIKLGIHGTINHASVPIRCPKPEDTDSGPIQSLYEEPTGGCGAVGKVVLTGVPDWVDRLINFPGAPESLRPHVVDLAGITAIAYCSIRCPRAGSRRQLLPVTMELMPDDGQGGEPGDWA